VLSDQDKRKQYDRLIFGESAETNSKFDNQENYDYWSSEKQSPKGRTRDYDKKQQDIKDKLRNYKDYSDFLKAYENHRDNHEARSKLYREMGFESSMKKHGIDYDHFQAGDDPENPVNKDYHVYRERYYEKYWDTKANHEYYSQSMSTRAWIVLKKVFDFYSDFALLWLGLATCLVMFNAKGRRKRLQSSSDQ
jgi:hypothetical protein